MRSCLDSETGEIHFQSPGGVHRRPQHAASTGHRHCGLWHSLLLCVGKIVVYNYY